MEEIMEHPQTNAIRPVGESINNALKILPEGAFNFGLYFNKWMYVVDRESLGDKWSRPKKAWACITDDETKPFKGNDCCPPNMQLDNLNVSLALFNGKDAYERAWFKEKRNGGFTDDRKTINLGGKWDRSFISNLLAARHKDLDAMAASFACVGYEYICLKVAMSSPLVIGLGNEHPSEKGFRFDWTLGIPVIPATGIKGVVRLAYLVDRLNELSDEKAARDFWNKAAGRWKETDKPLESLLSSEAQCFFGSGEVSNPKQSARRGKVIFLDALPATLPQLKAEIMNCHYKDYLNIKPGANGHRGPTEDQQLNPQKFWAVDDKDDKKKTVRFIFRVLIHRDITSDTNKKNHLLDAIKHALADHGLGAKTAIGHGRFSNDSLDSSYVIAPPSSPPLRIVWEKAILGWQPGSATLMALSLENKEKAECRLGNERTIVSDEIIIRIKKKKTVQAKVTVEPVGNSFKIISVEIN
jgi:CRISPR-associated protein Cmr6